MDKIIDKELDERYRMSLKILQFALYVIMDINERYVGEGNLYVNFEWEYIGNTIIFYETGVRVWDRIKKIENGVFIVEKSAKLYTMSSDGSIKIHSTIVGDIINHIPRYESLFTKYTEDDIRFILDEIGCKVIKYIRSMEYEERGIYIRVKNKIDKKFKKEYDNTIIDISSLFDTKCSK